MDPAALQSLLAGHGAGELITATARGLLATLLPFVHDAGAGPHGALLGHLARNNDQWQLPVQGEAMVVLRGPDAYVSPQSYASKAEHGRVVPTWNYVTAHVYGELVVHDDPQWTRDLVERLTRHHEGHGPTAWQVSDAPAAFLAGQLKAIVGIEVRITRIQAKAKLSQNRPAADVDGVVRDARARGDLAMAAAVEAARGSHGHDSRPRTVPGATGRGRS
jgi:transcriptional regulator